MNRSEQRKRRLEKYQKSLKLKKKQQLEKQAVKEKIVLEQRKKQYKKIARLFHACGNLTEELANK